MTVSTKTRVVLGLLVLAALIVLLLNWPAPPVPASAPSAPLPSAADHPEPAALDSGSPSARVQVAPSPVPTPAQVDSPRAAPKGPALWGYVTVDGIRRIPADFQLTVDSQVCQPELDSSAATYTLPRPVAKPSKVVVTSSESAISNLSVPPTGADGNWRLDLPLVSGRILYVHAIDAPSGAPEPDMALTLEVSALQESSVNMRVFYPQTRSGKTDAHGDCTFRGLPQEGSATLRDPNVPKIQEKPLLQLRLTQDSPSEFHETVSVHAMPATVTGTLPEVLENGQVRRARIAEGGRTMDTDTPATHDTHGNWSFECEVPSDWRVWISDGKTRVSQIEEVHVKQAKNYGPIQLRLMEASELRLHLVNAPATGIVTISIVEDAGDPYRYESVPITARELDQTLRLHGPARLTVRCNAGEQMSVSESRQLLRVDPSRTPELTVDLHGDRARGVTITLNGEAPKGETVLPFIGLDATGKPTMEGVIFHLRDGKSMDSVPVVPGTYLYLLQSDTSHGAIYGAVHVPDSGESAELHLEWNGVALPRASLGTGIEFESIEDVSGANWVDGLRQVRWSKSWGPEIETLLVPEHAKYHVLN